MKLIKFSFENNHTDWKLAETDFHPRLNLLVGASGVGKTKILNALKTAISVASGTRFNTLFETEWTLEFELNKDIYCEWKIKFAPQKGDSNGSEMPLIINDPELMLFPPDYTGSIGNFHKVYLKKLLAERRISYNETQPNAVAEPSYINNLITRFGRTKHIATFGNFLIFCKNINQLSN